MMSHKPEFILHTYYRSSCSGRLRIALNIKNIHADHVHVHLFNGDQRAAEYLEFNPSGSVPVLTHILPDGNAHSIAQSIAAMEYLEEIFPVQCPLLPPYSRPLERAKVRTLVNIIACDLQPLTNRRANRAIRDLDGDTKAWEHKWVIRGLKAYEDTIAKTAGKFSVGDEVTMADVCLVPAIWNAEQCGIELGQFPIVSRIYMSLLELQAVRRAHWSRQLDTPADLAWL